MSDSVFDVNSVYERKLAVLTERAERKAKKREQRQRQRRCFWTNPYGHAYETTEGSCYLHCVGCGKPKWDSSYDQ